ncbi:response regulator transcription factor [Kibdelosporangium phytohabitans]|uniref:Transcriptional regulator n=1 Tax=Kibdelosporangium phytohabitans TaxID=860235 RepID=A0A0N9I8F0_9PSEU|nr:response regulator transcription factor [Kibdelosporangium phytohabitans]ALG12182.1 transcriptional regulator [Kibdelosporangium phytohabitans]MBE1463710.1 DNA-binding response OmpR family regulator [Kibdelosporangium phytohabitans]
MRVLVAEDEPALAELVAEGLRKHALAVDVALSGDEALERLEVNRYAVVVLDRDLPGVHGDEVCRRIVAGPWASRVLMLTAAATKHDLIGGLSLGADDYLVKPFDFDELVARVRALARRSADVISPVLRHGDLELDVPRHQAVRRGRHLLLSKKEFAVLEMLLGARGSVVSAESLLESVWDENADPFTNAVRVTVSRLRTKLGDPPLIVTVPGVGYRI